MNSPVSVPINQAAEDIKTKADANFQKLKVIFKKLSESAEFVQDSINRQLILGLAAALVIAFWLLYDLGAPSFIAAPLLMIVLIPVFFFIWLNGIVGDIAGLSDTAENAEKELREALGHSSSHIENLKDELKQEETSTLKQLKNAFNLTRQLYGIKSVLEEVSEVGSIIASAMMMGNPIFLFIFLVMNAAVWLLCLAALVGAFFILV